MFYGHYKSSASFEMTTPVYCHQSLMKLTRSSEGDRRLHGLRRRTSLVQEGLQLRQAEPQLMPARSRSRTCRSARFLSVWCFGVTQGLAPEQGSRAGVATHFAVLRPTL